MKNLILVTAIAIVFYSCKKDVSPSSQTNTVPTSTVTSTTEHDPRLIGTWCLDSNIVYQGNYKMKSIPDAYNIYITGTGIVSDTIYIELSKKIIDNQHTDYVTSNFLQQAYPWSTKDDSIYFAQGGFNFAKDHMAKYAYSFYGNSISLYSTKNNAFMILAIPSKSWYHKVN